MSDLTDNEKANLLAHVDGKSLNDYDESFYKAMIMTDIPHSFELDSGVRRAILKFVCESETNAAHSSAVMLGFVHGYVVGRKLRRDIRAGSDIKKDKLDMKRLI